MSAKGSPHADRCSAARRPGVILRARKPALHALVCALVCGALIAPGCARRRSVREPAAPEPGSPVVRGARDGLELWWWVVTEPRSRGLVPAPLGPTGPQAAEPPPGPPPLEVTDLKSNLEDVLAPYLDRPVPIPESERAAWHAAGLRLVTVPVGDLEEMQSRLRTVGPAQRQWLGERPEWMDAITGASLDQPRVVTAGDRPRTLPAGSLHLLLRCWIAPDLSAGSDAGAVMRVEIVPEHRPPRSPRSRRLLTLEDAPSPPAGTLFDGLLAHLSMRDGVACLIVPEAPGVEWTADAPPDQPPAAPVQGVGPPVPPIPTVGEAMLSTAAFPDAGRRVRVVLVLVPRVPDRFRLTAGSPSPDF